MRLLKEFLENEQKEQEALQLLEGTAALVNGYKVSLDDWNATHSYHPPQLMYAATRTEPEEYSDHHDLALHVNFVNFVLEKGDEAWSVEMKFDKDYLEDHEKFKEADFVADILKIAPKLVLDAEDNKITDPEIIKGFKQVISQYTKEVDLLNYFYQHGDQKEVQPEDDRDYDNERYDTKTDNYY